MRKFPYVHANITGRFRGQEIREIIDIATKKSCKGRFLPNHKYLHKF